ncbi:hypothetical protein FOZ62_012756, partial [Perkinsus olseni]
VEHVNKDSSVFGLFGISMVPQSPRYFGWAANITSVMKALLYRNVIARLSYTLRTDMRQNSSLVSGQLTLGDAIDESQRGKYISPKHIFDPVTDRALTAVWVWSMKLLDEEGRILTKNERLTRRHPSSYLSLLDTGANLILLPQPNVLQDIVSKLRMNLKKQGYTEEEIDRMWWTANGFIRVEERVVRFLPVLTFRLGDGDNAVRIKVPPKHYCVNMGENEDIQYGTFENAVDGVNGDDDDDDVVVILRCLRLGIRVFNPNETFWTNEIPSDVEDGTDR